ncbi:porin [Derxia gummosa]|uniref:Porin n=1 Tax=Derxia gummosa DSM 723 TaxID=1121388 RepID=A0A8B6X1F5_9BURK|nr:porin [Derxia gummosa]
MKKSLLALAVLGTFGGAAFAQSTVTLYGIADAYYQNLDNGPKTTNRIDSGGLSGSRIGVRGSEDLGNGTSAIFTIEGGINLDDGSNAQGAVWGRQSFVGLKGNFGQATIGRHQTPLYDIVVNYGGAGNGQSIGAASNVFAFANGTPYTTTATVVTAPIARANNSVKYISPNFSGLTLTAFAAFGENTNNGVKTTAGNTLAGAAEYKIGAFAASALYQETKANPTTAVSVDKVRTVAVGASYNFGVVKPYVLYQDNKTSNFASYASTPATTTKSLSNYYVDLGISAPLGAGALTVDYAFLNNRNDQGVIGENGDAKSAGLRYDYSLSKRTTTYAGIQKIWNDSQSAYSLGGTASLASARGQDPRTIFLGARHTF